jgi:(1->4)-alpha-D-glucan 1-alpha-D-glucosylmutase
MTGQSSAWRATYRLQLGPGLGFAQARALVPYLRDLGISHLYLSPSFQARPGSTHGYDVIDPTLISAELGGETAFVELCQAAREAGMGVLLDIVPNHMAADEANPYWTLRREQFFDVDPRTGRHRRFFDIDHLAGVRQEDPEVFAETHALAFRLLRRGLIDGLRIDHPDGLADPAGYLRRLAEGGARHVWVEKILDPGEQLRDWPVEGTVGYEFLNDVAGLFVDPAAEGAFTALWEELSGEARPFGEWAQEAKLEQARTTFQPEVERLRELAAFPDLEDAVAALPVYRTYVVPGEPVAEEDRSVLAEAGVAGVLEQPGEFIVRYQQTTPPVQAKGVEDTAFYRYLRLLALNDVGGDPSRFGVSVEHFHAANAERAARFPRNLLATQTHDTKRSGDVRARLGALTFMADAFVAHVRHWCEVCAPLRRHGAPDRVEEYLIYQTLLGAWPIEPERLEAYLEKALREAKRTTNWISPDEAHEAGVKAFARGLYAHEPFLADFEPFAAQVAAAGDRAARRQLLLKLTVPGVADVYQGDELLALSLVDPDNRRPVDWERRRALLEEVRSGAAPREETRKLWLIQRVLALRARRPEAFAGDYAPLSAGPGACAFCRGGKVLVVVAVRDGWRDGGLEGAPEGRWSDVLGDGERELCAREPLVDLLDEDGLAVLERAG